MKNFLKKLWINIRGSIVSIALLIVLIVGSSIFIGSYVLLVFLIGILILAGLLSFTFWLQNKINDKFNW